MTSSEYYFEVKQEFIKKLEEFPPEVQERIRTKLEEFRRQANTYGIDPRQHNNTKFIASDRVWRLRVGDYRIFFDIFDKTVSILYVEHRKKAYK